MVSDCSYQAYNGNEQKDDATCYESSHQAYICDLCCNAGCSCYANQQTCHHLKHIMLGGHLMSCPQRYNYICYSNFFLKNNDKCIKLDMHIPSIYIYIYIYIYPDYTFFAFNFLSCRPVLIYIVLYGHQSF